MNGLIRVDYEHDSLTIESQTVAQQLQRRHAHVLEVLDSLVNDGTISQPELRSAKYTDAQGKPRRNYVLSEEAFLVAMPFIGGRKARQGQARLVKEFSKLRRQLNRATKARGELAWKQARDAGKLVRHQETAVIQEFVEYAEKQGSSHAQWYYANLTKATYHALFLLDHATNWTGVRELLDGGQLGVLTTAEIVVQKALKDGMTRKQHYKDVYHLATSKLQAQTALLPPATPPSLALGSVTPGSKALAVEGVI